MDPNACNGDLGTAIKEHGRATEKFPQRPSQIVPRSSLTATSVGISPDRKSTRDERAAHPSNVVPMPEARREAHTRDETRTSPRSMGRDISRSSHVPDFVRECLEPASGSSLGASELRATYEAWCADHDYEPLSQQKLGAELTGLGFTKWKSCGLIRYRDLQLVA